MRHWCHAALRAPRETWRRLGVKYLPGAQDLPSPFDVAGPRAALLFVTYCDPARAWHELCNRRRAGIGSIRIGGGGGYNACLML
jgi:hypothetical protein